MIIVTGGAGFIGSNLIKGLNSQGAEDILVVDHLRNGAKFANLADLEIADYLDRDEFLNRIRAGRSFNARAVLHQGACSATTEWDGRFMMTNNFEYSKHLLHYCLERQIPFLYASSAAVYGAGQVFREDRALEKPLNVYGYSKFLFDQYVRRLGPVRSQIAGFRYFNVYGPHEAHKGAMASVAFHLNQQLRAEGRCRLFQGCHGYGDGEQRRDFIHVDDCVRANLWFLEHPDRSGIFNLGTGTARSFNEVARAVLGWHGGGELDYIPFPDHLKESYQSFTLADIGALRAAGCQLAFTSLEAGVTRYLDWLNR